MLSRVPDSTLEFLDTREIRDKWYTRKRCGKHDMLGMEGSSVFIFFVATAFNNYLPLSCRLL